jgi:transcriptional regulator with XRE-family HTH domain
MPNHPMQSHAQALNDISAQLARQLGRRLRVMRSRASLSQEALSSLSGITRSQICLIEVGRVVPTVRTLVRIASALKISLVDLVCGVAVEVTH